MNAHTVDTFATATFFDGSSRAARHTNSKKRRTLAELAMVGFIFAVALLQLSSAIVHKPVATIDESGIAFVSP